MATEAKIQTVSDLAERLNRMQMMIVADYRGLTVAELSELRKVVREKGGEIVVAKNTLTRIAVRETGHEAVEPLLKGPTALAFSYEDIAGVAKAIDDYFKATKKDVKVKGGLLGTAAIGPGDLDRLAKLPTREQSLSRVLGGVNAPASRLVGAISGVMRNIAYVLKAYSEKTDSAA